MLCLSTSITDLKEKLGRMIVAYTYDGKPVTAHDLKAEGAMAAVLRYQVDAIVYTGGMAHSDRLCREISSYVGPLAPVLRFPGEFEMQALAAGALRVLHGQPVLDYCP